jgi:hypothetical protein
MIKQLWWVALASGLACSSSGQSSAGNDDATRAPGAGSEAPGNTTELAAEERGQNTRAVDELSLLETENGLVLQIERDGQVSQRACAGTCYDVCQGCLLEGCQLSGAPALCNAAADTCENRCNVCAGVGTQAQACDMPSCAGDLSCYFVTLGVPEEFRNAVRGVSPELVTPQPVSPEPGASNPEPAATPVEPGSADPNAGQPSSSGDSNGPGAY